MVIKVTFYYQRRQLKHEDRRKYVMKIAEPQHKPYIINPFGHYKPEGKKVRSYYQLNICIMTYRLRIK